jgi:hypothetical protein
VDEQRPIEIPYDAEECELFISSLGVVISMCQAQGRALGPDYEQTYRDGIAEIIRTARLDAGSEDRWLATPATLAATRRALRRPTSAPSPVWRAAP